MIDTATNKVVGFLVTGVGIAVSPEGRYVAAVSGGSERGQGAVTVADTFKNTKSTMHAGDFATAVAFSPNGKHIYVTNDYEYGICTMGCTQKVWEFNTTANIVGSTDLGMYSEAVAVTPDGKFVYVVSFYENVVSILDANLSFASTVSVGNFPSALAFAPDGKHAYVANQGDGTLSLIDTASHSVVATIMVAGVPMELPLRRMGTAPLSRLLMESFRLSTRPQTRS